MKKIQNIIWAICAIIWVYPIFTMAQEKPMKIICYNIYRGMEKDTTPDKRYFVEWMKAQDADILAIQEAYKTTQKEVEDLAVRYGHPYAVLLKQREKGTPVAITSKYPILHIEHVIESMHHGFIKAKINGYNIINLHLSPFRYEKRREEIEVILQTIKDCEACNKWIVMGDFNSVSPIDSLRYTDGKYVRNMQNLAKKYAYHDNLIDGDKIDYQVHRKILDAGLVDALHAYNPLLNIPRSARIDFIYLSPDLKETITFGEIKVDDFTQKYSDHYPLMIEIRKLKNER